MEVIFRAISPSANLAAAPYIIESYFTITVAPGNINDFNSVFFPYNSPAVTGPYRFPFQL
jgi:hypothetical protein